MTAFPSGNFGNSRIMDRRAVLLLGLSAFGESTMSGEIAPQAELPVFAVGDRWKWEMRDGFTGLKTSEVLRTITEITPTMIFGTENDGTFEMTPDMMIMRTATAVASGEPRLLSFPMRIGNKWAFKWSYVSRGGQNKGRQQFEVTVEAFERIMLNSHEHEAFRILAKGFWNNETTGSSGSGTATYWYSPKAKNLVRWIYRDRYNYEVRDLIDFTVNP